MAGGEPIETTVRTYLETYKSLVEDRVPTEFRQHLVRYHQIPCHVDVYYSPTRNSVVIEYGEPATDFTFNTVVRGAAPESFFVGANPRLDPFYNLQDVKNLFVADLTLDGPNPFRLNGSCSVRLHNVQILIRTHPLRRVVTDKNVRFAELLSGAELERLRQPREAALDEVLEVILQIKSASLTSGDVVQQLMDYRRDAALLLGSWTDTTSLDTQAVVRGRIRNHGYRPFTLMDYPDLPELTMRQKFVALLGLHKLFLVDETSASGHLIELDILRRNDLPRIVLRPGGKPSSYMAIEPPTDMEIVVEYTGPSDLATRLDDAVRTMNERLSEREETLRPSFPWRSDR